VEVIKSLNGSVDRLAQALKDVFIEAQEPVIERLDKLDKEVDTMNEELINLSLNTAKRFDKLAKRLEKVGVLG